MKFKISVLISGIICFFMGCSYAPLNSYITLPKENHKHDENKLRTDGYYYSTEINKVFCHFYNEKTKKYNSSQSVLAKSIDIVVLYQNGGAFQTDNVSWSGEPRTFWKDCNFPDSLNNYEEAMVNFENFVKNIEPMRKTKGKEDRGVFNISQTNEIKISIYHGANILSSYSHVGFYNGRILNDTTFTIQNILIDNKPQNQFEERIYHFKKFNLKPNPNNYMLENRHRFK